jgi:hypothetical protein
LTEDVLANGVDDVVYAAWVHQIARRSGLEDAAQLRQLSVGLIADALARGLVVAGDVEGGVHRPWDCSPAEALMRIAERWAEWGDEVPTPGAIVWLDLTEAGAAIGAAVLEREAHPPM